MLAPNKADLHPTPSGVVVKICGLTLLEDAAFAAESGADFLGIVLSETSKRRATAGQARAILNAQFRQPVFMVFGYDDADYIATTFKTLAQKNTRLQIMADHPEIERLLKLAPIEQIMPSISAAQEVTPTDLLRWEEHPLVLFDSHRGLTPRPPLLKERGGSETEGVRPEGSPLRRVAGGTGKTFNPENITGLARRYLLAGGLNAENVAGIMAKVHPHGVDVASGVEKAPGIKDHGKVRAFIENARRTEKTPPPSPPLNKGRGVEGGEGSSEP